MRGFVDLHSHWIAGIDDGVRTPADGVALLRALHQAGFSLVVGTPHMRPGMFDNDDVALKGAFTAMSAALAEAVAAAPLPEVRLASEHFLDDVVFERLRRGEGLPYPTAAESETPLAPRALEPGGRGRAALIEFGPHAFPHRVQARLFDLRRAGITTVLAHPERYAPVWKDDACLDPLLDAGAHLLLDLCALVGRYGRRAQAAAEKLLDDGAYEAACSDAHKAEDVPRVVQAIARLEEIVGAEEARRLLDGAPRKLLGD